jgi:hypothetical protein
MTVWLLDVASDLLRIGPIGIGAWVLWKIFPDD